MKFVRKEFNENWANECERGFVRVAISCVGWVDENQIEFL